MDAALVDWDALYTLVHREQYGLGRGCGCGRPTCNYLAMGYPLCPLCGEHHRVWPECSGLNDNGGRDA